jgi:oligopeptide/dipeptide ABC transporter ATP-binding protein
MIAMAVCLNPRLLIADECTTALDVMVQTQIVNLLKELRRELNLSMIFINHDLALIAEICDRVAVMYAGRIVETGTVRDVFFRPAHPYVVQLLKALPRMDGPVDQLSSISGSPPRLQDIAEGCAFLPRCSAGDRTCARQTPPQVEAAPGHLAACIKVKPGREVL